jgi:hypothetical protein
MKFEWCWRHFPTSNYILLAAISLLVWELVWESVLISSGSSSLPIAICEELNRGLSYQVRRQSPLNRLIINIFIYFLFRVQWSRKSNSWPREYYPKSSQLDHTWWLSNLDFYPNKCIIFRWFFFLGKFKNLVIFWKILILFKYLYTKTLVIVMTISFGQWRGSPVDESDGFGLDC